MSIRWHSGVILLYVLSTKERGKKKEETTLPCVLYNFAMAGRHSLKEILEILREQIPLLRERYNVQTLEVFGSYVHDEQKKDSDLDILVTFKEAPSLLTFITIENYLSDLVGIKVDMVMKDSLKPRIGEQIQREAIPIKIEELHDRNEFDALIKQARKQAREAGLERKDINSAVASARHHK